MDSEQIKELSGQTICLHNFRNPQDIITFENKIKENGLALIHLEDSEIKTEWDKDKRKVVSIGQLSDGYHTFDELYEHRCLLFLLFAASYNEQLDAIEKQIVVDSNHENKYAWWSHYHHDGTFIEGWLIAGVELKGKMITYHLPVKYVNKLGKHLRYVQRAPEWDGHTSQDVLDRMLAAL